MAKYCRDCDKDIGPVCDFCKHYNFNPNKDGAYISCGYCTLNKESRMPHEGCEDFECFNYKICLKCRRALVNEDMKLEEGCKWCVSE